jgi:hypothetical protein
LQIQLPYDPDHDDPQSSESEEKLCHLFRDDTKKLLDIATMVEVQNDSRKTPIIKGDSGVVVVVIVW